MVSYQITVAAGKPQHQLWVNLEVRGYEDDKGIKRMGEDVAFPASHSWYEI